MANLVIDIGNTQAKIAVFDDQQLVWFKRTEAITNELIEEAAATYAINKGIFSSVVKQQDFWVLPGNIKMVQFGTQMIKNIKNLYRTPQTLGLDRLAAVAGMAAINPGVANLVIDAGTAITYDYVDTQSNYYGGSISPGINMRYKALNNYTANLPLQAADKQFAGTFGDDTATAITSGVQNGVKYEAEGFIKSYAGNNTKLNIVLTGGDADFLDTLLKNSIFAPYIKVDPYLVLRGLNAVLTAYND